MPFAVRRASLLQQIPAHPERVPFAVRRPARSVSASRSDTEAELLEDIELDPNNLM